MLPSVEIQRPFSLPLGLLAIQHNCDEYWIDLLSTAADVFRLVLCGFNTFGIHQGLLAFVIQFCVNASSSKTRVKSI